MSSPAHAASKQDAAIAPVPTLCDVHRYYPAIFKCLSPQWAYLFFKHNRHTGWEMRAGRPCAALPDWL